VHPLDLEVDIQFMRNRLEQHQEQGMKTHHVPLQTSCFTLTLDLSHLIAGPVAWQRIDRQSRDRLGTRRDRRGASQWPDQSPDCRIAYLRHDFSGRARCTQCDRPAKPLLRL
jgi:hypothetical protein